MAKKTGKALPDKVEQFDLLNFKNHLLREENAKIRLAATQVSLEVAQKELAAFQGELKRKYRMGDADKIDLATCKIVRTKPA